MPDRRYFFVFGEVLEPNGGAHVMFEMVERLAGAGVDARVLYTRSNFFYPFMKMPAAGAWSPRLKVLRVSRLKTAVSSLKHRPPAADRAMRWPQVDPGADDIIVVPEYRYPELAAAFPDNRVLVLAQGNYPFLTAFERDRRLGLAGLDRVSGFLTTSDACRDSVALFDPGFLGELRLDLDAGLYGFAESKAFQIAYMSRRRGHEVMIFEQMMGELLPDVPLVRIHDVSREEAAQMIRDSLFFVSFSEKEGFGLPAAEALSSGAIVTGYTGLGGEEFFTEETGFPVPDSDIVALMGTLKELVAEYRSDPARLDRKRRAASKYVQEKYDKEVATSQLIATWGALEKYLDKE